MTRIPLTKYAEIHKKDPSSVRKKARMGHFKTAKKDGRDWFIDDKEPYIDKRSEFAIALNKKRKEAKECKN